MKEATPGEIIARLKQTEEAIQAAQDAAVHLSALLTRFAEQNSVTPYQSALARHRMGNAHGALGEALLEVIHAHDAIKEIGTMIDVPMPRTGGGGK